MKPHRLLCLLALCFLFGCNDKTPKTAATTNAPGSNPLNAPNDYLGGLANGRNKAIATTDIASLNQAIQMFNTEHDRYPKDLNELVQEKLIVRIPDAPYGMKLDYDSTSGTVSVVNAE
ncbi:MAG TPA: hypothetical protein VFB72_10160 [Verrucomicrobiae bacterium]|nr:hypothetical protein [Verrucomicrobiae bacterium]